jgi:hypothetical protein
MFEYCRLRPHCSAIKMGRSLPSENAISNIVLIPAPHTGRCELNAMNCCGLRSCSISKYICAGCKPGSAMWIPAFQPSRNISSAATYYGICD